ncbi:hypothetical protein LGT39_00825 [Demequina sp. TTPB684]|uniref:hypothetical protein n=1 Tax=unclassified Demequina TaxID=2620311 RepID=UPI001CF0FF94|nr:MULTISPECIES: hypothetical protein [unclassified Demequina]MCB2411388.1 hypothetical protein [Demequina sp. TTPB684]UPU87769.1 hypothetical protein LGT36_010980 [Demequina sp. TMPB413]
MRRSERLLRAAVAACLSTGVALTMHVAGGGALPALPGIAVPLMLAFAVSVHLAGKTMSRWRLGAAVASSQALFHALFALGSGATFVTHSGDAHTGHAPGAFAIHASGSHAAQSHLTPSMLGAHVGAAIATYAVLRRADVLIALIRDAAAALVSRLTVPAPTVIATGAAVVPPRPTRTPINIARCPHAPRGPPLRLA